MHWLVELLCLRILSSFLTCLAPWLPVGVRHTSLRLHPSSSRKGSGELPLFLEPHTKGRPCSTQGHERRRRFNRSKRTLSSWKMSDTCLWRWGEILITEAEIALSLGAEER